MGRHSKRAPRNADNPLASAASRLQGEVARIRYDALDRQFGPGGTPVHTTDKLGLPQDPDSSAGMSSRHGFVQSIAQTTVPVQHLQGLSSVHMLGDEGGMVGNANGVYYPGSRTLAFRGGIGSRDVGEHADRVFTAVHEIGHHVENTARGTMAMGGRSEGLAENYAERHTPSFPITHQGVTMDYKPKSTYDTHVPYPDSPAWKTSWDQSGKLSRQQFVKTRAKGTLPEEY